jgi:hypothetical protein
MIEYNTDFEICIYDPDTSDFVEGKITHLSDYLIKVKLEKPYVYWVSQRAITPARLKSGHTFIHNYQKLAEQLLRLAYEKVKYIDENIDDLEYNYMLLQEDLYELDTLANQHVARRIKRTLQEDFFRRGVLNTTVCGFVFNAYDRTLIMDIVKAYCEDKTKIYKASALSKS